MLLSSTVSVVLAAEWSGTLRSGYSYTDNLGSQLTVDQGLGTSNTQSRSGWANQGNLVLQSMNTKGGQSLELFGLYDLGLSTSNNDNSNNNSDDTAKDILNLVLSAGLFRALSANWLWRFSGDIDIYRYELARVSGYDGYGANLTFGYFGNNLQGLDLTLAWKYEDHNQSENPDFQYGTDRLWLNLLYYLPHAKDAVVWSLQGKVKRNINDNSDFRDYTSFLLGLGAGNWQWGKIQGFAGLQWRSNYYDPSESTSQNVNSNASAPRSHEQSGNPPGGGQMGGGSGGGGMGGGDNDNIPIVSSQAVNDQLLSAVLTFTYPFSRHWSARLSADAGRYTASTGVDENLFSVFAGLQWGF